MTIELRGHQARNMAQPEPVYRYGYYSNYYGGSRRQEVSKETNNLNVAKALLAGARTKKERNKYKALVNSLR